VEKPLMLFLNDSQVIPQSLFTARLIGDRMVVKLTCPSIRERQTSVLVEQLAATVARAKGRLVLELSEVHTCTCAWINAMLDLAKQCRAAGGELLLISVPDSLRKLLIGTGLSKNFTIVSRAAKARAILGLADIEPWKLALVRLLDLPVAQGQYAKAA